MNRNKKLVKKIMANRQAAKEQAAKNKKAK